MTKKLTPKDMKNTVEISVNGIPCQAYILTYEKIKPDPKADNPYDYYGYTELEYVLYDRTGYRAHWLDKIVDKKKLHGEVEEQILLQLEEEE